MVDTNGRYRIDSLTPGDFYLYVMETDPDNPAPDELKSGFSDIRPLAYGVPVTVQARQTTNNVNFRFRPNPTKSSVEALTLHHDSLTVDRYTLHGHVSIEGRRAGADVEVRAYPAHVPYRSLEQFMGDPVLYTQVEPDGSFTLESLPKGQYQVAAYLDVNDNQLVETGIDRMTRPLDAPVIHIGPDSHIQH